MCVSRRQRCEINSESHIPVRRSRSSFNSDFLLKKRSSSLTSRSMIVSSTCRRWTMACRETATAAVATRLLPRCRTKSTHLSSSGRTALIFSLLTRLTLNYNHVLSFYATRFNQHSSRVLHTCEASTSNQNQTNFQKQKQQEQLASSSASTSKLPSLDRTRINGSSASINGFTRSESSASFAPSEAPTPAKRVRIEYPILPYFQTVTTLPRCFQSRLSEVVVYDDLAPSQLDAHTAPLTIANTDRYLQGPTPIVATAYNTSEDVLEVFNLRYFSKLNDL